MLVKTCVQQVRAINPLSTTSAEHSRKIVPVDTQDFRYLRFRAIGNMAKTGANGNFDGFPYEHFEDSRPGYGWKSFIEKRAHYEHNSAKGLSGSIGDLPDAFLNKYKYTDPNTSWSSLILPENTNQRLAILNAEGQSNGDIEVLMRLDTKLMDDPDIEPDVRKALKRIIRMVDTGQTLTCSMGTNVGHSVCSTCGNKVEFSNQYCNHLKPGSKGGVSIVNANQVRDLLTTGSLRQEWLPHLVVSAFDVNEIVKGASNKGVAVRNVELNHVLSFFELSIVGTPAYTDAKQLEKLASQAGEDREAYLANVRRELGDDTVLDLYSIMQKEGIISNSCQVQ